ncbi:MAG TPA: MFS transporter [Mycobacteriales bacterium]|nr:MFS transporter [Mycobacteriales bacterium]
MRLPDNLSALRVRNFRLFAGGQVLSLIGRWMFFTTQDWLVVQLGGHGNALGTVVALQFLPTLLLSPYTGVLADRFPKRKILYVTQTYFSVVALFAFITVVTHTATITTVCVQAFLVGLMWSLDTPTRQSFVSEMVGTEHLTNAIAINSVVFNTARIVGPALAGLAIAGVGDAPVFGITAFTQLGVLSGLLRMRASELQPAKRIQRGKGQVREGLRYVRNRPDLMMPILLIFIVSAIGLNFPITLALSAKHFHGGSATYGLLSSTLAVGNLGGALVATRRQRPRQRTMILAALAFGVAELVAALMPNLPLFMLALVPTGLAILTLTTTCNAYVQLGAEETFRGRVMSLYLMVFLGSTPIGAPIVGAICEHWGARAGLAAGGLASLVAGLGALVWLRRQDRRRPTPRRAGLRLPVDDTELAPVT